MNFKFYPNESKINDFLEFPRLVNSDTEDSENDNDNFKDLIIEEYMEFIKRAEAKLLPFSKEIERFYSKVSLDYYDFPNLILKANLIYGYANEQDYLNLLLSLDDHQIKRSIIYTILISEEMVGPKKDIMASADKISSSNQEMMSFIKDLPIEAGAKWNLFLIIEDPVKYMKMYVELMSKLLPIFETTYSEVKDNVISYGKYLEDFLNNNGAQGLAEITYSMVESKILSEDTNNIFISAIMSYSLNIVTSVDIPYLVWGLKMEDAFKAIKEKNENKLNERIQIFKNLGDKTRYEVLKLIASGESSTKKIANTLNVSSATISYHLNALLTTKIIKLDKSNNKIGCLVDWNLVNDAFMALKEDLGIE